MTGRAVRPDKKRYLINIAKEVSTRATCSAMKVGCVIASADGHILTTGYNGAVHGHRHCRTKNGKCIENDHRHRVVHAEQNAIAYAAKHGVSLNDGIGYITHGPCQKCRMLLYQAGVKTVVVDRATGPKKEPTLTPKRN